MLACETNSISRRVGRMTYEVDMEGRRHRKRIYHINMLREWVAQKAPSYWEDEVVKEEGDDIICWEKEGEEEPLINELLSPQRTKELQSLLYSFKDVLCSKPGKTRTTEH